MPMQQPYINVVNDVDMVYGLKTPIDQFIQAKGLKRFNQAMNFNKNPNSLATQAKNIPSVRNDPQGVQRNLDALVYIQNHAKYNTALQGDQGQTRRKCKGILEFQLQGKQLPVHFILATFDTRLAAAKLKWDHDPLVSGTVPENSKDEEVTHAEIRWLYRNKDNANVRRLVQFWTFQSNDFVPVGPPWEFGTEEEKKAWAEYGTHLEIKRLSAINL